MKLVQVIGTSADSTFLDFIVNFAFIKNQKMISINALNIYFETIVNVTYAFVHLTEQVLGS